MVSDNPLAPTINKKAAFGRFFYSSGELAIPQNRSKYGTALAESGEFEVWGSKDVLFLARGLDLPGCFAPILFNLLQSLSELG